MSEIIIAGAGIIGLSCAWRLAQRGHKVTIFDAKEAAREASWAAAGMLAPGGEVESGEAIAKLALASLKLYPEFVRELEDASGLPIEFSRCGAVELGDSGKAERQAELGIRSEPVDGGRFYPDDAVVNPRDVNAGLLVACRRLGVTLRENEAVVEIQNEGRVVRSAFAEYPADLTVIAAGAWSSALWETFPRVYPVRGHLLAFHLPPGELSTILRSGEIYMFQRKSGDLIVGSSTEDAGFDRSISGEIARRIHEDAAKLMPKLAELKPFEIWNGLRPAIEAPVPAIGRVQGTSVWTACGHYRNGILLAPETARIVSESLT